MAFVIVACAFLALAASSAAAESLQERDPESSVLVVDEPAETDDGPASQTDQDLVQVGSAPLPPGWCYSDAIGTYECKFKTPDWFPFDDAPTCPEGTVYHPETGKCINDQLSIPDPVPATVEDCEEQIEGTLVQETDEQPDADCREAQLIQPSR
jgi:hypothetical protein